ncbi:RNA polymerase sigma-70 factor (sigma-E family) [Knoellia remsis]|uniref:RNA polymerase sigma-70 factor (Sigma-E family) n=1 Tax=Knoellia remsis TaxID=407159 RepID=A0A2T0UQM1_9MICO|nr:SigE family RNA polymerase sigma factor [Knoellia remsis]PRY60225.1 RNA polymerase sigma-70 factor (sigma-E family) [Knoellia remsis]
MSRMYDEEFATFAAGATPRLLRSAWLICGDATEAEDLVQSAMLKVYLRWGRLRTRQPIAYARKCILNDHIDEHRRRRRESPVRQLPETAHHDAEPEDTDHVVRLLAALPQRERQVVVMRHYAGLSEAEVADLLDVSVGTVKSSASRGLAKLRETLIATGDVATTKEDHHA